MEKSISVQLINGRLWKNKNEAKAHFSNILAAFCDGERVVKVMDIVDLLERYDRSASSPNEKWAN
jgi:hypothetical protein